MKYVGLDASNLEAGLQVVLGHLSNSDGHEQLYNTAARGLHLASKGHQVLARSTLRQLSLYRYFHGVTSAHGYCTGHPDPAKPLELIPWDMVAACPAVTSWVVHGRQLDGFSADKQEQLAAAASKLKRLEVTWADSDCEADMAPETASDEQLQGLGRVMQATRQLEEVNIACFMPKPWLVADPDSTSFNTEAVSSSDPGLPPLPLRSWKSRGVPCELLSHWVAQQRVSSSLTQLEMATYNEVLVIEELAGLRGLQELRVPLSSRYTHTGLDTMTAITYLQLPGSLDAVSAVCALTGLRHLRLDDNRDDDMRLLEVPNSLSALKVLSYLRVGSHRATADIPAELGDWLPCLVRCEVHGFTLAAVPASLSRLTHLDLSHNKAPQLTLPTSLTRLRGLATYAAAYTSLVGLGNLTGLEELNVSYSQALGSNLGVLQPLTRLRTLSLDGVRNLDPATFTSLGALQQLVTLRMYEIPTSTLNQVDWLAVKPLPALEVLWMGGGDEHGLACPAVWLAQLTALTGLDMYGLEVSGGDGLESLPVQLQELSLDWSHSQQQLPCGLSRLTALRILRAEDKCQPLDQLPSWLSLLSSLEYLDVDGASVHTEQQVLAQMPQLRGVRIDGGMTNVVFNQAQHLHYGKVTSWQ